MNDYDPDELGIDPSRECENCGEMVHVTYNGECVTKCSNVPDLTPFRALVEEWRYEYELPAGSSGYLEVAKAYEKCVDELQAVIEDYE